MLVLPKLDEIGLCSLAGAYRGGIFGYHDRPPCTLGIQH